MTNFIALILGLIIFLVISWLLDKAVFNTEFFNKTIRKHKNFQLIFKLFLIIWLFVTVATPDILENSFHIPRMAWIVRGILVGVFFKLFKYKEDI